MNPNMSFVKYIIVGGIIATIALPLICAWLDERDERKNRKKGGAR